MRIAPPTLFAAVAVAAGGDPDLPDGSHVRLLSAAELGPPIAPMMLWRGRTFPVRIAEPQNGLIHLEAATLPPGSVAVAVEAQAGTLTVTDTLGGEISRRSAAPIIAAAPLVQRATVTPATNVLVHAALPEQFDALLAQTASKQVVPVLLSAPLSGAAAWYAGGGSFDAAMARVTAGAPRRRTMLYPPAPGAGLLTPDAEKARIAALAPNVLDQWSQLVVPKVADASGKLVPPVARVQSATVPAPAPGAPPPPQSADLPLWGSLVMQSADYGIARLLGLGTVLPPAASAGPFVSGSRGIEMVWAVGLFALTPDALITLDDDNKPVGNIEWPVDPGEAAIIQVAAGLVSDLGKVIAQAQAAGLVVRVALTAAAVPPPPDPPRLPVPTPATPAWIPSMEAPNVGYRQSFNLGFVPNTVVGLAFTSDEAQPGIFQPRNPKGATEARLAMLPGRDLDYLTVLSDVVMKITGPVAYRFAGADLFGRFGPVVACTANPPARPKPPKPAPQLVVVRALVPNSDPAPRPPGQAKVTIPVPAAAALPAGALPIAKLMTRFGPAPLGTLPFAAQPFQPAPADPPVVILDLPPLAPMATGSWVLEARFDDQAGASSDIAAIPITIQDGRSPPPILAGPGLVWTSRPNAAATVEVALSWTPGPGAAGYHVYVAGARGLLPTMPPGIDLATASRAAIGMAGTTGAAQHPRAAFSRLTDEAVKADGDGRVRYRFEVPRAQRTVSFLRVVPVAANGAEADFAGCALVPVAVPTDMALPPPRIVGQIGKNGAELLVEVTGLPPGGPAGGASIRLRRASGSVRDPVYAPVLTTAALTAAAAPGATSATVPFADASVRPFVPSTWWAEVALPPEPVLPSGAGLAPADVRPDYGWQQQPMAAPFSKLSPPFTLVPVPDDVPMLAAGQATATVAVGLINPVLAVRTLTVTLPAPPRTDPNAVGPYRLRGWLRGAGDAAPVPIFDAPIDSTPFVVSYTSPAAITMPQSCWLMVVDPMGREGAVTKLAVKPQPI